MGRGWLGRPKLLGIGKLVVCGWLGRPKLVGGRWLGRLGIGKLVVCGWLGRPKLVGCGWLGRPKLLVLAHSARACSSDARASSHHAAAKADRRAHGSSLIAARCDPWLCISA